MGWRDRLARVVTGKEWVPVDEARKEGFRKALRVLLEEGSNKIDPDFEKSSMVMGNASSMSAASAKMPGTSWSNQGNTNWALIARLSQRLASDFSQAPSEVEEALAAEGLSWGPPFPPGRPLDPFWGYRRPPRTWDYAIGENIQLVPRWNRISFITLKSLIDSYYAAQIAVRHLINDVRSLDYQFVPPENVLEDVSEDVAKAEEWMRYPDGVQPFRAWVAEYLQDVLRYDAGTLYIRRNKLGEPIALEVVDGTTIIPLIDFFGRPPRDDVDQATLDKIKEIGGTFHGTKVPAYLQIIEGMPWVWLTLDDIIYQPINPLPESQYGLAPMEAVLLQANTDIRFQWHFLQYFTEGSIPAGFMEAPPDLSDPRQVEEWQRHWDAIMLGDQAKLQQIRWVPAGSRFTPVKDQKFDPDFVLYLMRCTAAAFGVVPNDLGFTDDVNRSTAGVQVDVQFRVGTLPLIRHIEDLLNAFLREHLHLKARIQFDTGQGSSHRLEVAQTHDIYIKNGTLSPDEVRMSLGKRVSRERPITRFVDNERSGPIPLRSLEVFSGQIDPSTYAPSPAEVKSPLKELPKIMVPAPGVAGPRGGVRGKEGEQISEQVASTFLGNSPKVKKQGAKSDFSDQGLDVNHWLSLGPEHDVERSPLEYDIAYKQLRQWKANSLNRVRKGVPPRIFPDLDPFLVQAIWPELEKASDPEEVRALFDAKIPAILKRLKRKAAGILVQAEDTGRVLLVQRKYDKHDPGEPRARWEIPGGRLDGGHSGVPDDSVWAGAVREWSEETGAHLPPDINPVGGFVSADGEYEVFIVRLPHEADLELKPQEAEVSDVGWWSVDDLDDPQIREKLKEELDLLDPLLQKANPLTESFHRRADHIVEKYTPLISDAMGQVYQSRTIHSLMQRSWTQGEG